MIGRNPLRGPSVIMEPRFLSMNNSQPVSGLRITCYELEELFQEKHAFYSSDVGFFKTQMSSKVFVFKEKRNSVTARKKGDKLEALSECMLVTVNTLICTCR
jgi:hypothetical protein